jgi:hypothetical protein
MVDQPVPLPDTTSVHQKPSGRLQRLEANDENWRERLLACDLPTLVHFSANTPADAEAETRLLAMELTHNAYYIRLSAAATSQAAEDYGLRIAPTVLLFSNGKPIAHFIGTGNISAAIAVSIANAEASATAPALTKDDIRRASAQLARASSIGTWQDALLSGIFAGIGTALAFAHLSPAPAFLLSGLLLQFLIRNPNTGLTASQQFFAIALMMTIALYWREALALFAH